MELMEFLRDSYTLISVILSSHEVLKETLHTDEWSGRIWADSIQTRYLGQRIGEIIDWLHM